MLLDRFVSVLGYGCGETFAQDRSKNRAIELSMGFLCSFGKRTVSRSICAAGRNNADWSADYKIYSRSPWNPDDMFNPVIEDYLERYKDGPVGLAFDDTKLRKTGKKIKTAFWQRDPMSPPFHTNLVYGLRFLQVSLLYSHHHEGEYPARGFPVRFIECPAVKKPGKKGTREQWIEYKQAIKTNNLSMRGLEVIHELRKRLDDMNATHRNMLLSLDGSFCNRTIFKSAIDRVDLVARCRKDAKLCFPVPEGSRRKFSVEKFTPESVRKDDNILWRKARIYFGGAWRDIRYKEVNNILWQRGASTRRLKLIIVAPQPYKLSPHSKTNYREPAYLLSTDCSSDISILLQNYFDRWQIEVNHREEKDILGVGQAQVWAQKSVPRQPSFAVASYSLLMLACLKEFGPGRTPDYLPLPKWRKKPSRPSILDMVSLLRHELQFSSISTTCSFKIPSNMRNNIADYAFT
jgi:hypothetical protein